MRLRLRPQGHVVYGVAFSPDGGTLAAALFNGTAHVWDAATGKELRVLKGHVEEVRAVAFSPDGKTLATGGEDQTVRLWDVTTGRQRLAPGGLDGLVRRIAFAPDGRTVATAGEEKVIRLLDAATGAERRQLVGHDRRVTAVAFSPDGRFLASGGEDSTIRLWDPSTGRELLRGNHAGVSRDLAFGPDGTLASGGHVTAIRLWKVPARVPVAPGKGPASWHESKWLERLDTRFVERMVFSPSGRALILVMTGQPLSIWDMEEAAPRPFREDAVRLGDLSHFALAPDGHTAVSVHPDARGGGLFGGGALGRVWRWDLRTKKDGAALVQKEGQGVSILHGAVAPDGRSVATVGTDGIIRLWELSTGRQRRQWSGRADGPATAMAFAPDSRTLAVAGTDRTVLLWDTLPAAERRGLSDCWADLRGNNAATAFGAITRLARSPVESVSFLTERLRPVPRTPPECLRRLVADLDAPAFATRQKAEEELERVGEAAEPLLREVLEGKATLEVRKRVERLLARRDRELLITEQLRTIRALEALERAGTAEARRLLRELADGAPSAWLTHEARTTLKRLERLQAPRK